MSLMLTLLDAGRCSCCRRSHSGATSPGDGRSITSVMIPLFLPDRLVGRVGLAVLLPFLRPQGPDALAALAHELDREVGGHLDDAFAHLEEHADHDVLLVGQVVYEAPRHLAAAAGVA